MTIAEKTELSGDKDIFILYKEGLFYKCFNEDTMVFSKYVKLYKISVKYIKNVSANVYSLGFPAREMEKGKLCKESILEKIGASHYEEKDKYIVFFLKDKNLKSGYLEWQKTISLDSKGEVINEKIIPYNNPDNPIYNMIESYDLANNTPMQGLLFIQQLKEIMAIINKNNGNI
jgi:hypothetical protein